MEITEPYKLREFHGELFRRGCPISGDVLSFGEGRTDRDKEEYAIGQFLMWMGPGGIAQYSLDHPGKIHVAAIGGVFDFSYKPKWGSEMAHKVGYDFGAFVSAGELPEDIVGFINRNPRERTGKLVLMVAEDGRFGGASCSFGPLICEPKVELTGSVRREGGRLIYALSSGVELDYSACLVG
jgi:hypothetical protein